MKKVYIKDSKIMYLPEEEHKPINLIGMIGMISELDWCSATDFEVVKFSPIPSFELEPFMVRRGLLLQPKPSSIIHNGFVYRDKTDNVLIFENISIWGRICMLFSSCIIVRCETYLHETPKVPQKTTINMTALSWVDRWKSKRQEKKKRRTKKYPPFESTDEVEGDAASNNQQS